MRSRQVKKTYRRRKLVRVTQVMRCGTRVELTAALKKLGLSGRINTAFIERVKKDAAAKRGCLGAPDVVDGPGSAAITGPPPLVAGLLPLRAAARVIARGAGAAHRPRRQACAATLSATDTGNGCRTNQSALERPRGADGSGRANADRCRLRRGKQASEPACAPDWDRGRPHGVQRGDHEYRIRVKADPKVVERPEPNYPPRTTRAPFTQTPIQFGDTTW